MNVDPHIWLRWAAPFLTTGRSEWLRAMQAELSHIPDQRAQHQFARGCFFSILNDFSRSRRGLNYIARGGGACCILTLSLFGVWSAVHISDTAPTSLVPYMIMALCLFYMGAAGLLITSLNYLKTYVKFGTKLAVAGWLYGTFASSMTAPVSLSFVQALSIEMAGFMIGLYALTIWLGWLYTPGGCDECEA